MLNPGRSLIVAVLSLLIAGCAGTQGVHYIENATGQPFPRHALADEVFLDGTGPTARRLALNRPAARYAKPLPTGKPTRAIGRPQSTEVGATDVTSSTTGSRSSVTGGAKTFNEWLDDERRQDARMRAIMDICRC